MQWHSVIFKMIKFFKMQGTHQSNLRCNSSWLSLGLPNIFEMKPELFELITADPSGRPPDDADSTNWEATTCCCTTKFWDCKLLLCSEVAGILTTFGTEVSWDPGIGFPAPIGPGIEKLRRTFDDESFLFPACEDWVGSWWLIWEVGPKVCADVPMLVGSTTEVALDVLSAAWRRLFIRLSRNLKGNKLVSTFTWPGH